MTNPVAKLLPKRFRKDVPIVPVVRLSGVISPTASRLQSTLSLASCAEVLDKAFAMKQAPAVAISVNSPGGSPVQSRLIFQRIRDLAAEHDKTVLVFAEDVAASGGYMIAAAGDEIIADPSSIIGSIGVVSSGFGFVEAIDKLGIERRVYTSGENKATLDPFQPEQADDVAHLKSLQANVHDVFIDLVKSRRGDRLTDHPDLFTGRFWAGGKAKELGLVDDIGDMRGVLRARFGDKTQMKLISPSRGFLGRRQANGVMAGHEIARNMADGALQSLEERSLWARYGR